MSTASFGKPFNVKLTLRRPGSTVALMAEIELEQLGIQNQYVVTSRRDFVTLPPLQDHIQLECNAWIQMPGTEPVVGRIIILHMFHMSREDIMFEGLDTSPSLQWYRMYKEVSTADGRPLPNVPTTGAYFFVDKVAQ